MTFYYLCSLPHLDIWTLMASHNSHLIIPMFSPVPAMKWLVLHHKNEFCVIITQTEPPRLATNELSFL